MNRRLPNDPSPLFRFFYRPSMIDPHYDRALWSWAFRLMLAVTIVAGLFFWAAYLARSAAHG